jgi:translation initiation factor 1
VKPKHTFRGVVLRHAPRAVTAAAGGLNPGARGGDGPARVRVGREIAGRAGKGVSVISGLPLDAAGLAELATRLKKLCGAGGAAKNGVIEIQGDHRERLVSELQKLGYAAKKSGG